MNIDYLHADLKSLDYLDTDERTLLLWSLVVLNDLNQLYACLVMSQTNPRDKSPVGLARHNQTMFFLTLLAGKLSEAWDAFHRHFAENESFKGRLAHLPDESRSSYRELQDYFQRTKNPVRMMRNWVSFHYGDELRDVLERLPSVATINIWLASSLANVRSDIGSEAAAVSMNQEFTTNQGMLGYERFLHDVLRVHRWFGGLLNGLILFLLGSFPGGPLPLDVEVPAGGTGTLPPFLDPSKLKTYPADDSPGGIRIIGDDSPEARTENA